MKKKHFHDFFKTYQIEMNVITTSTTEAHDSESASMTLFFRLERITKFATEKANI